MSFPSRGGRGSHGGSGMSSLFANGAFFDGHWPWWKVSIVFDLKSMKMGSFGGIALM